MRQMQSSIADVLGNKSARACNTMVFELTTFNGIDLVPHVHQLARRVNLYRRMWAKHPRVQADIGALWHYYKGKHFMGTYSTDTGTQAPPPGHPGRALWKPTIPMMGPMALLLFSIAQVNGTMDEHNCMNRPDHLPIDLFSTPHQMIDQS